MSLWRPFEREEVDYVYSLNLDIYVSDRRLESVQIILEDGTMLEVLFSKNANELGKPFKIEHYERGTYFDYYYMVPVSSIDRFEFTITYYDITQFGETPYFPKSHTETHVLDMRNPDMDVYKLIHGHGLLEIDWEN